MTHFAHTKGGQELYIERKFKATLIRVDGSDEDLELRGGSIEPIATLLKCELPNILRFPKGVMIVDDSGLRKGLKPNRKASALYDGIIVGDALWFTREEFDAFDASLPTCD